MHSGVAHRYTAVPGEYYSQEPSTQARNDRYMIEAMPLGEATIRRCLENAHKTVEDIDDLFIVSCTGLDIPGLDLRLAGSLGMRPDLRRTCVLGMGCYAALPALERAREVVLAYPERNALVLAIELCSLHFQFDDSMESIVASALFGDGAAAVLVGSGDHSGHPYLVDARTFCDYRTFDHMAFHVTDHGFRMRLSAQVPDVLAANVPEIVARLLTPHRLETKDIAFWCVHPGGSKIVDYVQSSLGLAESQLDFSRSVLRDKGNMSSATIFFVLDEIIRCGNPKPGDYAVLMAFGPGLTLESALVQWK